MKVHSLLGTLLALWVSAAVSVAAQPTQAERELFEQTKAQAEKGSPEAQLRLGALYASGIGVSKSAKKAAQWHRKAAEQGLARAEYQLGLDYAEGKGVKPDEEEAVKWFRKAADQGLVEAELDLGLCFEEGTGVRMNGVEAVKWFRKAADQGMVRAKYEVGRCFLEGTGVAKSIDEGIKWMQEAAELGDASAQNRLAQAYEKGEGLPKDNVQAYKWFTLAAAQDDENANDIRVSIAKVENLMTKDQVAEAQQLAREFKPGQKAVPAASTTAAAKTNAVDNATALAGGANVGFVNVKADDDHSEVFVDGAFVGNPPTRLKLAPGTHVVEVRRSGCKDYHREISVGAGADLNLQVTLEKQ
jgi:TPR repeat protein